MRWRNASSSPACARAIRSLFTAASSRQNVSPGLGDPLTHVDAFGRGNRAPGVPAMPSPPRIVRRFPAAPATAPGASPKIARWRSGHRIITIELGPAGVKVALLPDGSESGLLHDPIDRRVVRDGDERRRRSKAND